MDLSLYIHVPFCASKCAYCSFYSLGRGYSRDDQEAFVSAVIEEGRRALAGLEVTSLPSVFIGGGTPSSLGLPLWRSLLEGVQGLVAPYPSGEAAREWTVEANPESLTREKLLAAAEAGVNRLSMGIQSFDPRSLALLGRSAGPEQNRQALELLSTQWNGSWNADLICEIPGQSAASAGRDWEILESFQPPHVSLYTLSIEEGTSLGDKQARNELPDSNDEVWPFLRSALARSGYRAYEISNYHRDGSPPCLHNLRYWRMRPYLGLGPGAVSTIPGGGGIMRRENSPDLPAYLSQGGAAPAEDQALTPREFLEEYLLMGLRTAEGISLDDFLAVFRSPLDSLLPRWLDRGLREGWLVQEGGRVSAAGEGILFLNRRLVEAFDELDRLGADRLSLPRWP